jgi:hypothetical protein
MKNPENVQQDSPFRRKEGPSSGTNSSPVVLGTGQSNNSENEVASSLHSKEDEKPGQRQATIGSRSRFVVLQEPVNVERPPSGISSRHS